MKFVIQTALFFAFLILIPKIIFSQAPNLGATSSFVLFTAAGAFSNDGASIATGDIGTNVGAFTGFPPGIVIGTIHVADALTAQAATDVDMAYMYLEGLTCGLVIGTTLGGGQMLTPNIYCLGAASTLNGDLILDAECDPNAIFIFKIDGAFSSTTLSNVILINAASACNIYWQINGAVSLGEGSVFRGNILANGAISLLEGSSLYGRGLSRAGAIDMHNNIATLDLLPTASVITAGGSTTFCDGGSVTLSGNCGGIWSNGSSSPSITVFASGDYFVTTTNACGNIQSNHIIVTVLQLPVCTITGMDPICVGSSTLFCAPVGIGYGYLWDNGSTTRCITVSMSGTYTVTVTDALGCTSSCSKTLNINPLPDCTITGLDSICQGQSTTFCVLNAGPSSTFIWNTGSTSNCINVTTAGTYSVTVTDNMGCTNACSKSIIVNALPSCTITGNNTICAGQSTQLCAPVATGNSYMWSTGATSNCINVSSAGVYSVTVTRRGCSNTCSVTVVVNPNPICLITGNSPICFGTSTLFCAPVGTGYSYIWDNGSTARCISVSIAGTYNVTVTDALGCTSSCSKLLTINPAPICTIIGLDSICQGQSTSFCVLNGGPPNTYIWNTGSTSTCINVTTAGTYSVTVTDLLGCTSVCSKSIIVNPLPVCTITGNNTICAGQLTQLCAPVATGNSYMWSNGATSNCINVSSAGVYSVTVTRRGCSNTCSVTVIVNPNPICLITGNSPICFGSSTLFCAPVGTGNSYIWDNGSTARCISVSIAGTYNVTVTDALGCTSSCSKLLTINPALICNIVGLDSICQGQTTSFCVLNSGPPNTFIWSTGSTSTCINVNTAGTYSVTVTDPSGCISICNKSLIVNPLPDCTITGNGTICSGQPTQLCAPLVTGNSYLWSTGAATNCITVSSAGIYTVTVTRRGCSNTCSKTVVVSPSPICTITGISPICPGGSSSFCAPVGTGYSYLWNNGAITRCITVSTAGTYVVTVTDALGCTSSCSKTLALNPAPFCTITGLDSLCQGQTTSFCVNSGSSTNTYLWSNGSTSNCINVNTTGTYSVTVTDLLGCQSICTKSLQVNALPECTIIGNGSICTGQTTQLCAPVATGNTYVWSNGSTANCITVSSAGVYTVTVTRRGCSSICSKTVVVSTYPICNITGISPICSGTSTLFCAPEGPGYTYIWNENTNQEVRTRCLSVNAARTYTVKVINNGCASVCSKTLAVIPSPICFITGNLHPWPGKTTTLCAPVGMTAYKWNFANATTRCITVNMGGMYTVTVTAANGCTSSCMVMVTYNGSSDFTSNDSGNDPNTSAESEQNDQSIQDIDQVDLSYKGSSMMIHAFPNPFYFKSVIEFRIYNGDSHVSIDLYDVNGSKVATLFNRNIEQDKLYQVEVDRNQYQPGVYYYKAINGNHYVNKKLILIR